MISLINGNRLRVSLSLCFLTLGTAAFAAGEKVPSQSSDLATTDQTVVTERALGILQMPEVKNARAVAELRWRRVLQDDPPKEAWDSFESSIDEFVFNYVLKATDSDPNYPKVLRVYTPPHELGGMQVPGSRWGGDNPDNIYRIIPIDGKAHYRLDAQQYGDGPGNVSYTLVGDFETAKTLNSLENKNIQMDRDGKFSITLDPQPANGRPNHIQTKPGARYLLIRDSLSDWRQRANSLSIHRLDPADAPPLTDQQIAALAAEIIVDGVAPVYFYIKADHSTPNAMPSFHRSGAMGGLVSQSASVAEGNVANDEALVITLNPGDAAYFSLVAYDYWFRTIDLPRITSSLDNAQSLRSADGTITYVVSIKDPGVHNWIDTGGLHNVILHCRLQGLPEKQASDPWIKSQLVKLSNLKSVLPKDTRWVSAEARAQQRKERILSYQARMADRL